MCLGMATQHVIEQLLLGVVLGGGVVKGLHVTVLGLKLLARAPDNLVVAEGAPPWPGLKVMM
eukprot:3825604-Pleurochrysis_carterae.AAC.1